MLNAVEANWCNPFDLDNVPKQLINICTGKVATKEIEKSLSNYLERAAEKTTNIFERSVESFWRPIKRDKIMTFKDGTKKPISLSKKVVVGSEFMFRRIMCAARFQEIDINDLLSYELTLVPSALFHEDGSMRKSAKAELCHRLEQNTEKMDLPPNVDSYIIDGMVLIQELKPTSSMTFNDLGQIFLKRILSSGRKYNARRFTVIFDNYISQSLKSAERLRRGESSDITEYKVSGSRKVPVFKDFLKSSANKKSLLIFMVDNILKNAANLLDKDESLIIGGGSENPENVFIITQDKEPELWQKFKSNQEEADTRIILHVVAEREHGNTILVRSVDTDVFILLLHHYVVTKQIRGCRLFMELGHLKDKRFLSIQDIVESLGETVSKNILAIHCLTGCDTTSAFFKIGKKTAFDVLVKNTEILKELYNLPFLPDSEAVNLSTKYVLLLYRNKKNDISSLNGLRIQLTTNSNRPAMELPPTDNAFQQHLKRYSTYYETWVC